MKNNILMKKNIFWNTVGALTLSFTSLFYSIILTRLCDLGNVGIFVFGFSFACMMVTLASFGGRTYQVTDIKNEINTFTYIMTKYLTVNITLILTAIYLVFKDYTMYKTVAILLLCIFKFLEEISDVYYGVLQKHNKLYLVGQCQFIKSIVNVLGFLIVVYFTKSILYSILYITMVNSIFTFFIERSFAKKEEKWDFKFSFDKTKKLLIANSFICFYLFLTSYIITVPKYAIDKFLSSEIQGIFNTVIMPATIMFMFSTFIVTPILVDISKLYNEKKYNELKKILLKIIGIIIVLSMLAIFCAYLLGIPILSLIYNINLKPYKYELIIILFGAALYTITATIGTVLIAMRETKSQLFVTIINAIFAYIICYILVSKYGIKGGAIGYFITMIFRFITYIILTIITFKKYEKSKVVIK